ncbi:UPF0711 protein C18orf21 homolog [Melanotaenia boesemani]|uniref:UPF0711 protein C18orf21 homolog n=1 Tax=Melanotaenia boesemani TaxID=1250792 RepID=UPI001C05485B|nr:UPF0711 protein C18orf21 homolog [Melanotaenia boesemani]
MERRSAKFLFDASLLYQEKSPELSRFFSQLFLLKDNAQQNKTLLQSTSVCPYCYQWLKPDNHRIRLWPKPRPSARVQSILLRKARGKRLSLVQTRLLLRFQNSSSKLMATCHACSKTSRHKGMNREFIASFAKTHTPPGSAGKHKTPQSSNRSNMTTPKTPGKDKTPANTPRSSISSNVSGSSSTSSKSSKSKNWVVQRLSKILTRQEGESSKKGGLKDFLSSL